MTRTAPDVLQGADDLIRTLPIDRGAVLLLQAAAHADADQAQRAWDTLVSDAGDADGVLRWALRGAGRRLLPLLGTRAELLELPLEVSRACRDATVEAWGLNERLLALAAPTVVRLVSAGIPAVAMKGTALLGDPYPAHRLRPIGDVDLLVPRHRLRGALRITAAEGWTDPEGRRPLRSVARHAVNLGGPVVGPSLDLHWRTSSLIPHRAWRQPFPRAEDLEPLPVGHPLAGTGLLRPRAELLVVQIATHGVEWNNPSPHWLVDLAQLLAANPELDGDRVRDLAGRDRLGLQVEAGLRLCQRMLGVSAPFPVAHVAPRSLRAADDELGRLNAARRARDLRDQPGPVRAARRFWLYARAGCLRRHLTSRLQVAVAAAITWWWVRR